MKNFVNTAKVEYTVNGQRRQVISNSVAISAILSDNTLRGRVISSKNSQKWILKLISKNSGAIVYAMQGVHSRNFSFTINPQKEYVVEFSANPNCTLRLYNTPDSVTDVRWCD